MSTPTTKRRSALLFVTLLLSTSATAQDDPTENPPDTPQVEWPKLDRTDTRRLKKQYGALRRAKKAERITEIEDELAGLGPGAAPELLERLSDHESNVNESLSSVLDRITTPEHAPLLAQLAEDRTVATRLYVLRRLTEMQLPEMVAVFGRAHQDEHPEIALQGAFGLASAGDASAIEAIFEHCKEHWGDDANRLKQALGPCRNADTAQKVIYLMESGEERDTVTGLRVLRFVGTKDKAALIGRYLDFESNAVKKEAINTLRVVIDGAEPLDTLPVFRTIEMAEEWRRRIQ